MLNSNFHFNHSSNAHEYIYGGECDPYEKKKNEEYQAKLDAIEAAKKQAKRVRFFVNVKLICKLCPEYAIQESEVKNGEYVNLPKVLEDLAKRVEISDFERVFELIVTRFSIDFREYIFKTWLRCLKRFDYVTAQQKFEKNKLRLFLKIYERYKVDLLKIGRMFERLRSIRATCKDELCDYKSNVLFQNLGKRMGECLMDLSVDEIKTYAASLANVYALFEEVYQRSDMLLKEHYYNLATFARMIGLSLPYFELLEQGGEFKPERALSEIKKTLKDRFWLGQIIRMKRRGYENFAAAFGLIGDQKWQSTYVSKGGLRFYIKQQINNHKFLSLSSIVNNSTGVRVNLMDVYLSSISNPEKRAIELRVRAKGAEKIAKDLGYSGLFVTATLPSRFHANSNTYDGSSVRDGLRWFLKRWEVTRAMLHKHKVKYFGIRCSEPHADSTMHGHFVIFVAPEDEETLIRIMRGSWVNCEPDDAKGNGWRIGRFNYKKLDPSKGSAVSYITKYIAKNIYSDDDVTKSDENENLSLKDNVNHVRAWASTWGIRQFQFFGLPNVTVYRELRRVKNNELKGLGVPVSPDLRKVIEFCGLGDFAEYIRQQTPTADEADVFKWAYEVKNEYYVNEDKEWCRKVVGVSSLRSRTDVVSRLESWTVDKGQWDGAAKFDPNFGSAEGGGGADPSWTTKNNCNHANSSFFEQFENFEDFASDIENLKKFYSKPS